MQKMFWNLCMDPNEIFGSNFKADCDLSYFCGLTIGLHFLQVPKPCHMRLRKGGCQFQRANSKTWCPPGYRFDLSSIRIGKQTFLKRLEVVVDLHTVIKGWRKMAVKTRSDKLGQSWKKRFFPHEKGNFQVHRNVELVLTIRVILKSPDETIFAV